MKTKILFVSLLILFGVIGVVKAQDSASDPSDIIKVFRSYKVVENINIKVPTVLEVPFSSDIIERYDFAVLDKNTNTFEPYYLKQSYNEIPLSAVSVPSVNNIKALLDRDSKTFVDFILPETAQGQVQITLSSSRPITSDMLTTLLDNNVSLPNKVEIRASVDGQDRIIVAKRDMKDQTVSFPQTTSDKWQITFWYSQPLRIVDLRLNQNNSTTMQSIRFLAQPSHSYNIYFNPDRSVSATVAEAGNLSSAKDALDIADAKTQSNASYVMADVDGDEVPDIRDNCVTVKNASQEDVDGNGRGDVCDDFDQDGRINSLDNCPDNPNRDQLDTDADGIGDVCDKEESRLTEKYPWIPWVGMGVAAVVLVTLLVLTVGSKNKNGPDVPSMPQS